MAGSLTRSDLVLSRMFAIRERVSLQFRVEAFNTFNHPNFDAPVQTFDNPSFGTIQVAEASRQMQFGLKVRW